MVQLSSSTQPKTFFDNLSDAALGNILRLHAYRPRIALWPLRIHNQELSNISHPRHPLRTAAQHVMKDLLPSGVGEHAQKSIFDAFGKRCSALALFSNGFVPMIWHTCPDLKFLTLHFADGVDRTPSFRTLLASLSTVERLDVSSTPSSSAILDAVAAYGTGLTALIIDVVNLCLKESLNRMLEATGTTLLQLKLEQVKEATCDPQAGFDIKSIFRFCPMVTDLAVGDFRDSGEVLMGNQVELFISYGAHLNKISRWVQLAPYELLRKMAQHCPNAELDAHLAAKNCTKKCLESFGTADRTLDSAK